MAVSESTLLAVERTRLAYERTLMAWVRTATSLAQSLTGELEKPQVEASRLPQFASNLSDLQKQVGSLRSFMK